MFTWLTPLNPATLFEKIDRAQTAGPVCGYKFSVAKKASVFIWLTPLNPATLFEKIDRAQTAGPVCVSKFYFPKRFPCLLG